jgi:hypothetical protein
MVPDRPDIAGHVREYSAYRLDRSACPDQRHRGISERGCPNPEVWLEGQRWAHCVPLNPSGPPTEQIHLDLAGVNARHAHASF